MLSYWFSFKKRFGGWLVLFDETDVLLHNVIIVKSACRYFES